MKNQKKQRIDVPSQPPQQTETLNQTSDKQVSDNSQAYTYPVQPAVIYVPPSTQGTSTAIPYAQKSTSAVTYTQEQINAYQQQAANSYQTTSSATQPYQANNYQYYPNNIYQYQTAYTQQPTTAPYAQYQYPVNYQQGGVPYYQIYTTQHLQTVPSNSPQTNRSGSNKKGRGKR